MRLVAAQALAAAHACTQVAHAAPFRLSHSIEDAVANTVYIYVQSLLWIRSMYPRLRLWVLPIVPPPSVPLNPGQDRLYATALFNEVRRVPGDIHTAVDCALAAHPPWLTPPYHRCGTSHLRC